MDSDVHCKVNFAINGVPSATIGPVFNEAAAWARRQSFKTTVEQTLMRRLVTAFPFVRLGLPRSAGGRRL